MRHIKASWRMEIGRINMMDIQMTIDEKLNIWDMIDKVGFPFRLTKSYDKSVHDRGKGWYVNWCNDGNCLCVDALSCEMECPKGNEVWAETPYKAVEIALRRIGNE